MAIETLQDVRHALAAGERKHFGMVKVYITGYETDFQIPQKFVYRGCLHEDEIGDRCEKTMEGGPCSVHGAGKRGYRYRFDVYVVDGSISESSPPLRLSILDAASSLLGMKASTFGELSEWEQGEVVHAAIQPKQLRSIFITVDPAEHEHPLLVSFWKERVGPVCPW